MKPSFWLGQKLKLKPEISPSSAQDPMFMGGLQPSGSVSSQIVRYIFEFGLSVFNPDVNSPLSCELDVDDDELYVLTQLLGCLRKATLYML